MSRNKNNVIFCGTEVLQVNDHLNKDEVGKITDKLSLGELPTKGCLGIVLSTGFDTLKGKLIRKVVSNA